MKEIVEIKAFNLLHRNMLYKIKRCDVTHMKNKRIFIIQLQDLHR